MHDALTRSTSRRAGFQAGLKIRRLSEPKGGNCEPASFLFFFFLFFFSLSTKDRGLTQGVIAAPCLGQVSGLAVFSVVPPAQLHCTTTVESRRNELGCDSSRAAHRDGIGKLQT